MNRPDPTDDDEPTAPGELPEPHDDERGVNGCPADVGRCDVDEIEE